MRLNEDWVQMTFWGSCWHFLRSRPCCVSTVSTVLQRRWWRACRSGSTPSLSKCRLGPFTPLLSSGSYRATAWTPNGSTVTSATPASLTQREERWNVWVDFVTGSVCFVCYYLYDVIIFFSHQVLTFKEINWQSLRIEADAIESDDQDLSSTPLRLITNQGRIRIALKRRVCFNLSPSVILMETDVQSSLGDTLLSCLDKGL